MEKQEKTPKRKKKAAASKMSAVYSPQPPPPQQQQQPPVQHPPGSVQLPPPQGPPQQQQQQQPPGTGQGPPGGVGVGPMGPMGPMQQRVGPGPVGNPNVGGVGVGVMMGTPPNPNAQRGGVPTPQVNSAQIQKMLDENCGLIQTIQDFQNMGKAQECMSYHVALHRNLVYLAQLADPQMNISQILPVGHKATPNPDFNPQSYYNAIF